MSAPDFVHEAEMGFTHRELLSGLPAAVAPFRIERQSDLIYHLRRDESLADIDDDKTSRRIFSDRQATRHSGKKTNDSRRIFSDRQGAQRESEGAYVNTQPSERGGATPHSGKKTSEARVRLTLQPQRSRSIAAITLPVTSVRLEFFGFSDAGFERFMRRYKRYLHKGGG
ncbi:MAG: hypothetical protein ACR2P7_05050 [bacterium]